MHSFEEVLCIMDIGQTGKIPLFPIHRPGEFVFKSRPPGNQNLEKKLFFSSLQTSLRLPVTSLFKK